MGGAGTVISKRWVTTAILVTATNKHLISENLVGSFWLASYRLVQPDEGEVAGDASTTARWRTVFQCSIEEKGGRVVFGELP